jgi:hypothetical protein
MANTKSSGAQATTTPNRALFTWYQTLMKMSDREVSFKFANCIRRNLKLITERIGEIQEELYKIEQSKENQEYEKERIAINEKYCSKDKDGNPILKPGNNPNDPSAQAYDILDSKKEVYDKELAELKIKYKKFFDKKTKATERYNKELDKECTFKFATVDSRFCDGITANEIDILEGMIK